MSVFVTFIVEMTNGIFRSQSGALLGLFDSETRFDSSKRLRYVLFFTQVQLQPKENFDPCACVVACSCVDAFSR